MEVGRSRREGRSEETMAAKFVSVFVYLSKCSTFPSVAQICRWDHPQTFTEHTNSCIHT